MFYNKFTVAFLISFLLIVSVNTDKEEDDFYKLLNIARDASAKEIRQAFKKLAVKLHPDKNKDDVNAEARFIKLTKAYEILKDPESRKRYDLYGDTGEEKPKQPTYHSYTYYRDVFGIYDDDPLVITLSQSDYEISILDSHQAWFVNFYSPHCHHCHELAPTWRKLAEQLEGVVRVAAVNCEEDWILCRQLEIHSYPTLLFYEKEARIIDGERYSNDRTLERLEAFVLHKLKTEVKMVSSEKWNKDEFRKQPWLMLLCPKDNENCPDKGTQIKLAASLEGLMNVGVIWEPPLTKRFTNNYKQNPIVLWQWHGNNDVKDGFAEITPVKAVDFKEIVENVLNLLPDVQQVDEETFSNIRTKLRVGSEKPWLLCFHLGAATELSLQLKRLPAALPNMNLGLIHCARSRFLCGSLHVNHYPSWGVLKQGGAFELHHGREVFHEIVNFAKDSSKSTNLHALSPADFYNIIKEGSVWFIDWYAPWCPPCKRLMPEIRRASQHFSPDNVKFGTIDCTLHTSLCSKEGVQAYPTTILYNGTKVKHFHGVLNEKGIVEFVEDMLNSRVIELDSSSFARLMRKPENEIWFVDYFAPWCNPCQLLAPEIRKLAREMANFDIIKIAQVDCVANSELCTAQQVRSYPTIRLYPLGSKGMNEVVLYNGHRKMIDMKSFLISFLPSPVVKMNAKDFRKNILRKEYVLPWLVDFYAPWCQHCIHFEPDFIQAAQKLEKHIRSAKIDCEAERLFCQEMGVYSYPTVYLYLSPNEVKKIETQDPSEIVKLVKRHIQERREKQHVKDEL